MGVRSGRAGRGGVGGRWYMSVLVPRRSGVPPLMLLHSVVLAPSASLVSGVIGWGGRRVDGPRMLRVTRGGVVQVLPTAVAMGLVVVGGLACPLLLPQRPYSSSPSSGLRDSSIV